MVSCEYLNINDEKISKSKGNGITILDLAEEYNVDSIRYFFLSNGPEKKDSNFSTDEFKNIHNSDLVNKFGNFINRTLKFKGIEKIEVNELDEKIEDKISETYKIVSENIENLEFRKAIEEIMNLVEFANKYYDDEKPWVLFKEDKAKFDKVMYNCVNLIANLANLFEPVMPETSSKIKKYLNIDTNKWEKITVKDTVNLNDIPPLFERIK
jgi:methionyl-tRNA synthetase